MLKKKFVFVLLLVAALAFAACGSGGDKANDGDAAANEITVTLSIDIETLRTADPELASAYSNEDFIVEAKELTLPEGSNVVDALIASGAQYSDSSGYISEIAGLQAGIAGDYSGWLFTVNDEFAEVGASDYILNDGDKIRWRYSIDGGSDVGAPW